MAKLRLTKEHQQRLTGTRDAINALAPGAGDAFLEQMDLAPSDHIKKHSDVLNITLCWAETLQGYDFWDAIWDELVAQEQRNES